MQLQASGKCLISFNKCKMLISICLLNPKFRLFTDTP